MFLGPTNNECKVSQGNYGLPLTGNSQFINSHSEHLNKGKRNEKLVLSSNARAFVWPFYGYNALPKVKCFSPFSEKNSLQKPF